jgi:transcriptional regulator with XRE-family HTH domain
MSDAAYPGPGGRRPRPRPLLRTLVGKVLRRKRLGQRRTLADVARDARVSMPYLSEVERGRKEASSEVLAAVCQALGMELSDLLAEVGRDLAGDRVPARELAGDRVAVRDLATDRVAVRDQATDRVAVHDLATDSFAVRDLAGERVAARDLAGADGAVVLGMESARRRRDAALAPRRSGDVVLLAA